MIESTAAASTNPACSTCRTAGGIGEGGKGGHDALVNTAYEVGWAAETHEELLVLGGLDGALLGEALDDGDGLVELCLGHRGR